MNFYLNAFCTFFKIGLFTIGGGYAMGPLIEEEVELDKDWLATVYDVWQVLLEDPMVHDMVAMDSLDRMDDVGMPTVLWPKFRFRR